MREKSGIEGLYPTRQRLETLARAPKRDLQERIEAVRRVVEEDNIKSQPLLVGLARDPSQPVKLRTECIERIESSKILTNLTLSPETEIKATAFDRLAALARSTTQRRRP